MAGKVTAWEQRLGRAPGQPPDPATVGPTPPVGDVAVAATGEGGADLDGRPPLAASKATWVAYAARIGIDIGDAATKGDIIAAVDGVTST